MDSGNTAWMLTACALVLFMTPGLAFFYGGLVRNRNVLSTIMYCFMAMAVVSIVWVLWGYSLAFGTGTALIGDFSALGLENLEGDALLFATFQMMFAIITPALITGAIVERFKFSTYLIFLVLWVSLVYAPICHWVWAEEGWIFGLGALDFAGGTVVHINAGVAAIAAAALLGKRRNPAPEPHNVPYVVLGAAILWFGWFGFNAGSGLAANGQAVSAFIVTNLAAATAALTWGLISHIQTGKMSAIGVATGAVAGLVAITPASGFVGVMGALGIGLGAGIFCYFAVLLRAKTKLDDALEVAAVHGVGGIWGAPGHRHLRRRGHRRHGGPHRRQWRDHGHAGDSGPCDHRLLTGRHVDYPEGAGPYSRTGSAGKGVRRGPGPRPDNARRAWVCQ